jgi:hypothetical protein
VVLFSGLGFVFLILFLFLFLRFYVTGDRLVRFANSYTEETLNRTLLVEDAEFDLLHGFRFKSLHFAPTIDSLAAVDSFPIVQASVRTFELTYSLSQLWNRRVKINRLLLDRPQLIVGSTGPAPESATDSTNAFDLPLSLSIDRADIVNGSLSLETLDTQVQFDSFSVFLSDIWIPEGTFNPRETDIAGDINVRLSDHGVLFRQKGTKPMDPQLTIGGSLDIGMDLQIQPEQKVTFAGNVASPDLSLWQSSGDQLITGTLPFPIHFKCNATANLQTGEMECSDLFFQSDTVRWLDISARVNDVYTRPLINARIEESRIPLPQVWQLARQVVPELENHTLFLHEPAAEFSLKGSTVEGILHPDTGDHRLQFDVQVKLPDFGFTLDYGRAELEHLSMSGRLQGLVRGSTLSSLNSMVEGQYDSLYVFLPDSTALFTGPFSLSSDVHLDEELRPLSSRLHLEMSNALGADIQARFAAEGRTFSTLQGEGTVEVTNLDSRSFRNTPVHTTLGARLNVSLKGLDSLAADMTLQSDTTWVTGEQPFRLSPRTVQVHYLGGLSEDVFPVQIDSLAIRLDDFATGMLRGQVQAHTVRIDSMDWFVWHHPIYQSIQQGAALGTVLEISPEGRTHLRGHLDAQLHSIPMALEGKLNASIHQPRFSFPDQGLVVNNTVLNATAQLDSRRISDVVMNLNVDSVSFEHINRLTLTDNSLSLSASLDSLYRVELDSGKIQIPDLFTRAAFAGQMTDLDSQPVVDARLSWHQDVKDTLYLTPLVQLTGLQAGSLDVRMNNTVFDFSGQFKATDWGLSIRDQLEMSGLNAHIQIDQTFDMLEQQLYSSPPRINTPTEGTVDYWLYESYYRNSIPELSTLSIDRIRFSDYEITNVQSQLLLGESRLEIPELAAQLYGGSLAGRLSVNLGNGDLAHAGYTLSVHFSDLDSEQLVGEAEKKKKGKLSGNITIHGTGLDPEQTIDLGGHFYLTQIGPQVMLNLLRRLDPQGLDSGVSLTQRLINWGFKPRLLTFDIRHGYAYPSVQFSQPWYFPVKLQGGKVELARIPVDFFVQTALQQAVRTEGGE